MFFFMKAPFFKKCADFNCLHFLAGSENTEHNISGEEKEYSVKKLRP